MAVFRKDVCGVFCVVLTYISLAYADYVVVKWIILQTMSDSIWGPINVLLYNTVLFLLMMAHVRAVCSDPGIIPLPQTRMDFSDLNSEKQEAPHKEDWTVCTRCETYRPPRAHHCRICQRCIRKMDHHCPWLHSVILVMESSLFGLFVIAIMGDQLQAIFNDETAVEQMKKQGPYRPRKPKMALLTDVCGRDYPISWILPCQAAPRSVEPLSHYEV